jgi:hypothetical protein
LSEVDDALAGGRVGFEQAKALARAANPRVLDGIVGLQSKLVTVAEHAPYGVFTAELQGIVETLDQDGGFDPVRERARNKLFPHPVGDRVSIRGELVGEAALVVHQALEREADRLFRHAARDQDLAPQELAVPARSTLMAEGLMEICRRATARPRDHGTIPAADVTVIVRAEDPERVTTPDGVPVALGHIAHLLCDPVTYWYETDLKNQSLNLGRTQRLATRAQRRALLARDGGCVFPGCDRPASWCDAHHLTPWEHGGNTDIDNLALLCRFHHGVTHRTSWSMTRDRDGTFSWTTPSGRTLRSKRRTAA